MQSEFLTMAAVMPEAVDYAHVTALTMNLSGRFSGREIRSFGQKVIRHILAEKRVRLFMGQQINFRPQLPEKFRFVGTNKAFLCYDSELFRSNDERQYRHFLRDLHLRGQLPHHYLPDTNYVVLKMRYRQKPWTDFIAMSWVTDERQPRLKNVSQLRKVVNYVERLSEVEEMPVLVGGTFRMEPDDVGDELDGDLCCYGYEPSTPRRRMRSSNVFLCARPLRMAAVRPVACAKMTLESELYARWLNPEDAFYWDPVVGELMLPIETPDSLETARRRERQVGDDLRQRLGASSRARPLTGISSKHLLISSSMMRQQAAVLLPTAPVPPTPQEQLTAPPPPPPSIECSSSDDPSPETASPSSVGDASCLLPAIDEVSSEYERRDSTGSNAVDEATTGNGQGHPQTDQEREEKIFELLEAMMNDKTSTFFVGDELAEGRSEPSTSLDPVIFNLLKSARRQSIEELKATIRARIQSGACSPENLPENVAELLNHELPARTSPQTPSESSSERDGSEADGCLLRGAELEPEKPATFGRAPSYQELYDEDLIQTSTQCYMS